MRSMALRSPHHDHDHDHDLSNGHQVGGGSTSSPKDVVKLMSKMRSLEEERTSNISLLTSLRSELKHTRANAKELELAHKSTLREIESLMRRIAEERESWYGQEDIRVQEAVQALRDDMERERKARRRIESLNKELSKKLNDGNKAMVKALHELKSERKSRALMEDVCDELAREIGQDKEEIEALRQEQVRMREEVEEEQQMLHVAEVWREERVQMKLADANHEIEERVSIIDWLRQKLEEFIQAQKSFGGRIITSSERADIMEAERLWNAINMLQLRDGKGFSCQAAAEGSEMESMDANPLMDLSTVSFNHRHRWMLENLEEQNGFRRDRERGGGEKNKATTSAAATVAGGKRHHHGYGSDLESDQEEGVSFNDGESHSETIGRDGSDNNWERASEAKDEEEEERGKESDWGGEGSDGGTLSEEEEEEEEEDEVGNNRHQHSNLSDADKAGELDAAESQSVWSSDSMSQNYYSQTGSNERNNSALHPSASGNDHTRFNYDKSYFQPTTTSQVNRGMRGFTGGSKDARSSNSLSKR